MWRVSVALSGQDLMLTRSFEKHCLKPLKATMEMAAHQLAEDPQKKPRGSVDPLKAQESVQGSVAVQNFPLLAQEQYPRGQAAPVEAAQAPPAHSLPTVRCLAEKWAPCLHGAKTLKTKIACQGQD